MFESEDQGFFGFKTGFQYEHETRAIRVAVKPAYLDDQSDPEDDPAR